MDNKAEFLKQAFLKNGFPIEKMDLFLKYIELLQHWNKAFNLTAIHDFKEIVVLHIIDSLSINPYVKGENILDVGTGAGLPGIPLAILNPDRKFTLLDSNSKKTRFLTHVKHVLKLNNVEIVHSRSEEFKPGKCFDTILSRALASIKVMLTNTEHLICANGIFLAMKGIYPEKEIAELEKNFKIDAVHELKIEGMDAKRCVVCITKEI